MLPSPSSPASPDPSLPAPWRDDLAAVRVDGTPRRLAGDLVDAALRGWWRMWASQAGARVQRVDQVMQSLEGAPRTWCTLAGLLPGAVALPTRTAALAGLERADVVAARDHTPPRLVDLWRARRLRRKLRSARRTLEAEMARFEVWVAKDLAAAVADGDDGTSYTQLPTYALAARLEVLLRSTATWNAPMRVLLAAADSHAHDEPVAPRIATLVDAVTMHRAALHGTSIVLARALGAQLARTGSLATTDAVFDLPLADVLLLARGGATDASAGAPDTAI